MENIETNWVPTASSICGVKTEPARLKGINQWEIYDVILISLIWASHR
jgi:hypothetical protein